MYSRNRSGRASHRAHQRYALASRTQTGDDGSLSAISVSKYDHASRLFDAAFSSEMDTGAIETRADAAEQAKKDRKHGAASAVVKDRSSATVDAEVASVVRRRPELKDDDVAAGHFSSLSPDDSDDRSSPEFLPDGSGGARGAADRPGRDPELSCCSQGSLTLAVEHFQLVSPASSDVTTPGVGLHEAPSLSPKRRQTAKKSQKSKRKKKRWHRDQDDDDEGGQAEGEGDEDPLPSDKADENNSQEKGSCLSQDTSAARGETAGKQAEECVSEACTSKDSLSTSAGAAAPEPQTFSQQPPTAAAAAAAGPPQAGRPPSTAGDKLTPVHPAALCQRDNSTTEVLIKRANGKVMCRKDEKQYFTVIHNVQQAYQCRQSGESQEFADDVEYLLETMSDAGTNMKFLSTLSLLTKCVSSSFRNYLKAHDHVNLFLRILKDAPKDKPLALCTAAFVYVLARDRLTIGINAQSLSVIVQLLNWPDGSLYDSDTGVDEDYDHHRHEVWEALCSWRNEVQRCMGENRAVMFDFTERNLSASWLCVEALVFISSRMQETWFKKEFRVSGGLDRVALLFCRIVEEIMKPTAESHQHLLKLLQRPMRILENVTIKHRENQTRLVSFEGLNFMSNLLRWFDWSLKLIRELSPIRCRSSSTVREEMDKSHVSGDFLACTEDLRCLLRLLCNLSNNNDLCCTPLSETPVFLHSCLECVTFLIPRYVPCAERYDFLVLFLSLLINLAELRDKCRVIITDCTVSLWRENVGASSTVGSVEALCKIFCWHTANAVVADQEVDQMILNSQHSQVTAGEVSFSVIEESVQSALNKAGTHMEEHILASNVALLLGLLLLEKEDLSEQIKGAMPNKSFKPLVDALEKFLEFLKMTKITDDVAQRSIVTVIETFKILE